MVEIFVLKNGFNTKKKNCILLQSRRIERYDTILKTINLPTVYTSYRMAIL